MTEDTLQKIYLDFRDGKISPSDLLYRLSRYDLVHEHPPRDFKRRLMAKRTIITEGKRFIKKAPPKGPAFRLLRERYVKEYLYFLAAEKRTPPLPDFSQYIKQKIEESSLLTRQYNAMGNKEKFWSFISELEKTIAPKEQEIT